MLSSRRKGGGSATASSGADGLASTTHANGRASPYISAVEQGLAATGTPSGRTSPINRTSTLSTKVFRAVILAAVCISLLTGVRLMSALQASHGKAPTLVMPESPTELHFVASPPSNVVAAPVPSRVPAAEGCVGGAGVRVCSHQLSIGGEAGGGVLDGRGNANTTAALLRLLASRVSCFDVDMFLSSDGVPFIGHPVKEGARHGVAAAAVEALSATQLADGGTMSLEVLMAAVTAAPDAVETITIEPKLRLTSDVSALGKVGGSWETRVTGC